MKMWIMYWAEASSKLNILGPWGNKDEAYEYAKMINERPDNHAWVQEVELVKP